MLGGQFAAVLMRQTRSAMLESLGADYVRTARAKGLSEPRVVLGHALRNSLVTVLTLLGLRLGLLISGAVVTEQVFVIPGFGKLIVEAVFTRDYPIIQGVAIVSATAYIVASLGVDLLYSPRIGSAPTTWAATSSRACCSGCSPRSRSATTAPRRASSSAANSLDRWRACHRPSGVGRRSVASVRLPEPGNPTSPGTTRHAARH